MNDHVEYFALVARILELAGISAEDADLHFWRPGTWPELRDPAVDNAALRSKLNDMLIELVEQRWSGRERPAGLNAAIADLQRFDRVEPTYDEETIKALQGLETIRRRPRGYITTEPVLLTDDEIAAIELDNRIAITRGVAHDLDNLLQDAEMLAGMAEGLPMQSVLEALAGPLAVALAAVRAQIEADKS